MGQRPTALFNRVARDALCDGDGAGFVVGQREDEQVRDASSVIVSLPARRTGTGGRKDDPADLHSTRRERESRISSSGSSFDDAVGPTLPAARSGTATRSPAPSGGAAGCKSPQ